MKQRLHLTIALIAALLCAGGVATASAADSALAPAVATSHSATGDEELTHANDITDVVASAAESIEVLAEPSLSGSELVAASNDGDIEVTLPAQDGEVILHNQSSGEAMSVGLPTEAPVGSATVSDEGTVVYPAATSGNGVDIAIQVVEDGSVRMHTVIASPDLSHVFTYPLTVPEGTTLAMDADGGVIGTDPAGHFVLGIAAPWAKDANGNDVPTQYQIDGTSIIQTVSPIGTETYPLVADPWMGIALISKTSWAKNLWQYSPTLRVYPTHWGRFGAGPYARAAAWSETLSKTTRTGWPNPNTSSMANQFYCHYDIVRLRAPNKEYWGLDSKIPNRGYWGFVQNSCN